MTFLDVSAVVEGQTQAHHVAPGITYFFTSILVLMILCLALEEKIHAKKSLIVGVFAGVNIVE